MTANHCEFENHERDTKDNLEQGSTHPLLSEAFQSGYRAGDSAAASTAQNHLPGLSIDFSGRGSGDLRQFQNDIQVVTSFNDFVRNVESVEAKVLPSLSADQAQIFNDGINKLVAAEEKVFEDQINGSATKVTAPSSVEPTSSDTPTASGATGANGDGPTIHLSPSGIPGDTTPVVTVTSDSASQSVSPAGDAQTSNSTSSVPSDSAAAASPTPSPSQAGGRNYAVGLYEGETPSNPGFTQKYGFSPQYTIDNSYMGPGAEGSNPASNNGYPTVVATESFGGSYDANKAANGDYNKIYAGTIANEIAKNPVPAVRLDFEWAGNWFDWSPYKANGGSYDKPGVDPATWVAGFRNYVNELRSNPATANVKVSWDYPLNSKGANALDYYPGDQYVDIIGSDLYFNKQYDGANSQDAWNAKATGQYNLNDMAAFAAQHNKPMAFWEVSDNYGDGTDLTKFGQWVNSHNVVAVSYWDNNGSGGGQLESNPADAQAFQEQFTAPYTGTYWPSEPLPANKPAGY